MKKILREKAKGSGFRGQESFRFSSHRLKIVCAVLIVIEVVSFISIWQVSRYMYRQMSGNTRRMTDMLVGSVCYDLSWINKNLNQTVVDNVVWRGIEQENSIAFVESLTILKNSYNTIKSQYGEDFNFFIFSGEDARYYELTGVHLIFDRYKVIRSYLKEAVKNEQPNGEWRLVELDSGGFVYTLYRYQDRVAGVWIDEQSFLEKFSHIDYGPSGGVSLVYKDRSSLPGDAYFYELEPEKTDFGLAMVITGRDGMQAAFLLQYLVLFVGALVVAFSLLLYRHVSRKFLRPIRRFSDYLEEVEGDENMNDIRRTIESVEIEDAYQLLKKLMDQMQRLKISLYEQELEKKQIELDFRKIQIKPHFFINCLSGIYCMAENDDMEGIKKMSVQVSAYFRDVLMGSFEKVGLTRELSRVKNYVSVQSEWNAGKIRMHVEEKGDTAGACLPGLIITTFVENSIRHGGDGEEEIQVDILARMETADKPDERMLYIRISDNGGGYGTEMLEKLNSSDAPFEEMEGHHLGINNAKIRLKLIYENRGKIRFSNTEDGACVEMWIPQ
jgi:two-component system sensor histidine kinase YesM